MLKFRKLTLFIAVIVGLVNKSAAQSYYKDDSRTFYGGISFGSTFSQLNGDRYAGYKKLGLTGGAIVYAELAPKFATSLELLYTQKGAKSGRKEEKNAITTRINKYSVNLNYVELPVMFNYFDKRKSHFGLGASYSQLISQNEQATTTPVISDSATSADIYPFKPFDINGIVSLNLHLGKGFFLNVRYQRSILSVRDTYDQNLGRPESNGQHNNLWALRLMYIFN